MVRTNVIQELNLTLSTGCLSFLILKEAKENSLFQKGWFGLQASESVIDSLKKKKIRKCNKRRSPRSGTAPESISSVGESCHKEPNSVALTSASGHGNTVTRAPDLISRYNDFRGTI